jgi:hypothetical protein
MPPDWFVHRYFACGGVLAAGYCLDRAWVGCAFAWLIVAAVMLFWSLVDNEWKSRL